MASHLSIAERKRLSTLLEQGFSRAAVSRALGRAKSTITRELTRNRRGWWYCPGRPSSGLSVAAASAPGSAKWIAPPSPRR